ncbi:MAG: hypothetical protein ACRC9L_10305 [Brevinema sp.]
MGNKKICPVCGNEETRQGKLHGVATLHSLDSRVGIGGAELIFTFCAKCGEVLSIKVDNPKKIK